MINGGRLAGTITESADSAPGVDAAPVPATGNVTFHDPDLLDNPSVSIVNSTVTSSTLTLTATQQSALLDNLTLGSVNFSGGEGSVDWTYAATNSEIDFLSANDSVELTYSVEVNDQSGGAISFQGHT